MVSLAAAVPVPAAAAPPTARAQAAAPATLGLGSGGWNWQSPSPHGNALIAMSCVSASVCYAAGDGALAYAGSGVGGAVYTTTNGGTTWTDVSPPASSDPFFGISCFDATHCTAVGTNGIAMYTSTGSQWGGGRLTGNPFLLGDSCPGSTTCFTVGERGFIASNTALPASNTWTALTSGVTSDLYSVSCASATWCVADGLGGVILQTKDGSTWTRLNSTTTSDLYSIACVSTSVCMAAGKAGTLVYTSDGGTTWQVVAANSGLASLDSVSCTDANHCYAAGADGQVYFWASGQSPPGIASTPATGALYGISCPTATPAAVCFADGQFATIVATTNGGTGWTQKSAQAFVLDGVSCPTATTCFTAGWNPNAGDAGEVLITTDAGATWTAESGATSAANSKLLDAVSCPDTMHCWAAGAAGTVIATGDGGTTWQAQSSGVAGQLWQITCVDVSRCFAVGDSGAIVATIDGGAHWTAQVSHTTAQLTGVSCPTATTCYVAVKSTPGQILKTTNGGGSWNLSFDVLNDPNAGTTTAVFNAISCPTAASCYAVGNEGLIAATSDGGVNWRTDNSPFNQVIEAIACPSSNVCYAATFGQEILHTTTAGGSWEAQWGGVFGESWQGIACTDASTCLVTGGSLVVTTASAGAAWSLRMPSGPTGNVHGLSCTDDSNCYATANDKLMVTHNGGATWTSITLGTTANLLSISCPAAGDCFAVGWPHQVYKTTDAGATWTYLAPPLSGADDTLVGVSCAAATSCVTVGTAGLILSTADGTTWNREASGTTQLLEAVSCATSSSCVAVGRAGTVLVRSGGSWVQYASGTSKNLYGVDCPSTSVCYAAGDSGTLLKTSNGGATWAAQTSGTTHFLNAVRCPTTTVCLAAGQYGTMLITTDGASWTYDVEAPTVDSLDAIAWGDLNHAWIGGRGGSILYNDGVTGACGSVSGGPQPPSPQDAGTSVTISAAANGCLNPLYQFWMLPPSGGWKVVQAWSKNSTFAWDTTGLAAGSYRFSVWTRDLTSTNSYDSFFAFQYSLTAATCTGVSVTGAPSSTSVQRGQPVLFTAVASGCPNPLYEFWLLPPGGGWALAQPYSTSNTYNWTNTFVTAGTYRWSVWARDGSSSASYDAFSAFNYTITGTACTGVTASTSPSGTAAAGTPVTLTATASGCPYAYFEFWILPPGGTWRVARGYLLNGTYNWDTTGLAQGTYRFSVWAQDGTAPSSYQAFSAFDYTLTAASPCTAMSATANPANTAAIGTAVTVSGSVANTCPNPRYQFWLLPPSGGWTIVQAYSPNAIFTWNTSGLAPGTYRFSVWARDGGSTASYDTFSALVYTLTVPVCQMQAPTVNPTSPQPVGTAVILTASATGCPNPRFEFWIKDPSGAWTLLQAYSANATLTWNTAPYAPGMYYFSVWTRDAASPNAYDSYSTFWYTLN